MSMYPNSGCREMSTIPNTHTSERLPFLCAERTVKHHVNDLHLHNVPLVVTKKGFIDLYNFPRTPQNALVLEKLHCAYIFIWATWLHTNCRHLSDLHFLSSAGYWLLGSPLLKGHPQLGKKSSFLLPYFCIEGISSSSYQWRILAFLPSIYHIWYHIITHCTQFWLCESNLWFLMKVIMLSVPLVKDPN